MTKNAPAIYTKHRYSEKDLYAILKTKNLSAIIGIT